MRRRPLIMSGVGLAVLLVAWGAAYWYVGVDAAFLGGWFRSWRSTSPPISVTTISPSPGLEQSSEEPAVFTGWKQETVVRGLTKPTRMAFEPGTDDLLVSELGGAIWRIGVDGTKREVARGFTQLLGISVEADIGAAKLYVASRGTVSVLEYEADGTYGRRRDIVTGLPAGRHQTDLALIGPDGKLYIATGSRSDRGEGGIDPHEAAILAADPDGSNLEVYANGLRNPYGMQFFAGRLYVSDNGQDVPAAGVPDELNLVEAGRHYGWPECWGSVGVGSRNGCAERSDPVALLPEHSSANGFTFYEADQFPVEYHGNAFLALWGANSRDPEIGKKIVRLIPRDEPGQLWLVEDFVTGLGNPIDVKVDPRDGTLLILDFGTGQVLRVTAEYADR